MKSFKNKNQDIEKRSKVKASNHYFSQFQSNANWKNGNSNNDNDEAEDYLKGN